MWEIAQHLSNAAKSVLKVEFLFEVLSAHFIEIRYLDIPSI